MKAKRACEVLSLVRRAACVRATSSGVHDTARAALGPPRSTSRSRIVAGVRGAFGRHEPRSLTRVIAEHELGSLHFYRGRLPAAARSYRTALSAAQQMQPPSQAECAANLIGLATIARCRQQHAEAILWSRQAMEHAAAESDLQHAIAARRILATRCGNSASSSKRVKYSRPPNSSASHSTFPSNERRCCFRRHGSLMKRRASAASSRWHQNKRSPSSSLPKNWPLPANSWSRKWKH